MTKSLANKLYLKKKLYTFWMPAGRKIFEHINEFNKIILDLANIEVKFEDEDLSLLLLTSLPASYEHFVDTLLYGRDKIVLDLTNIEVKFEDEDLALLLLTILYPASNTRKGGEELIVGIHVSSRGKSRSKSRGGRLKCYICQSEDHLKRNCPKNNRKKSTGYVKKDEQPSSSGSTYDDSENAMGAVYSWVTTGSVKSEQLAVSFKCSVKKKDSHSAGLAQKTGTYERGGTTGAGKARDVWQEKSRWNHWEVRGISYLLLMIIPGGYGFITYRFKHEAFGKFKVEELVENQTGRTVKKLRTDNGLEFCNWEFEQLCIENGIARYLTVFGTPQQNGVAERMNKTLMDKVRCLLIRSGLPKTFWAEATCMAVYLINRSPSRAIEKKTPMEMWSGHPSDYRMLRIFGCVAYPHDKQGKLEPRAVKCVLLGYPKGVKGYRLYRLDDESSKIVTSRNVVFNESVMYKDTLKDSGAGNKSVEELQVEVELQRLNYHTPEEDQTDQEDGDDEDARDQETNQPPDLTDYHNMAAYAFVAVEEEDTHEPLTYQDAVACEDSSKWKDDMKEEMDSLRKNKTWELVDHLAGQKLVSCKWLFKIKEGIEGVQKPRYKARLVARGFTQRAGIDYNEVFSPVVRHTSIRVILALTACKDYELEQLDVKTAFLHGNLKEVIYMRQPQGYEQGNKVCLLKKSLYGLKQSPRSYEPGEYIYLLLYVDDMLIACKSKDEIGSSKSLLKKEFDMKELGEEKKILGMKIVRDRSRKILRVSQSRYISKILNNFRIDNGKSVKMPLGGHFKLLLKDCLVRDCDVERMSKVSYANAVRSLMYLIVCTRPDIAYAVSVVSRYLANSRKNHWEAVKWILKYLRGTANVGLVHEPNHGKHVDVTSFANSDYAKDPDKGRSITGYAFLVQGCVVSWKATLQHVVALSTTEAEYMALTEAVKEAIWLRGLLEELGVELNTVAVNCDNQGAIHLSRNHVFHERTKHINVRYHFIREVLEAKTVKVLKVGTEHNAADALTKVVPGLKLQHCLELLNVGVG
ncbi:retrotransposon protein, putative, ty1-copia subclass [Tanacetum coccineum]